MSFSLSELAGMCDSVASKAILATNAVLLTFQYIGPWAAFENLAFLGPFLVASCVFGSAIWTRGEDIYMPHDAGVGTTLMVQASWLLVAVAARPRWRPRACAWVHSTLTRPIAT
eukprot:3964375-Prymnesium_polylepis.1